VVHGGLGQIPISPGASGRPSWPLDHPRGRARSPARRSRCRCARDPEADGLADAPAEPRPVPMRWLDRDERDGVGLDSGRSVLRTLKAASTMIRTRSPAR
jgi:hypothetical protein